MLSSLIQTIDANPIPDHTTPSSLADALTKIPDPRHRRGVRYPLSEVLAVLVCAVVAGARTFTMIAEWATHAAQTHPVTATGQVPVLSTIHRIATLVDAEAFEATLHAWVRSQVAGEAIAIDGKELRGAKNAGHPRVFLMAAITHHTGCVIGQEAINEKTNEIPHFLPLLHQMGDVTGKIITADALHTQTEHAHTLHDLNAHYVFTVKRNQPGLYDRISSQTWASRPVQHATTEKGHGRITTWQITCQPAQEWIDFPHATQTIRLTRDRQHLGTGETSREHVYAITSLPTSDASPKRLHELIRGHWTIENRLHWVRDVTYDEDRSQIRTGNGPRLMATLRNLAITIHRLAGAKNIAKATRNAMRNPQHTRHLTGL
jgi:predicted transposase YbfD/YdcC